MAEKADQLEMTWSGLESQDDVGDFVRLYRDVYYRVRGLIYAMVGNRDDAEDLLQESSIVMWRKFSQFESDDPDRDFPKWSLTIAANHVRNFHRKRREQGVGGLSDEVLNKLTKVHNGARELFELRRDFLDICLKKLPTKERSFFESCTGRDCSLNAWAKRAGVTPNSVSLRLSRIRKSLQQCINRGLRQEAHHE
ncbi:sigma-70 family RNA polymerase sigma factor [Calycomorphotria hydatis]|uniref:RNA polymerase sigma factor n=1 Tax=Calycomorphotria hydatis TaxID=2528027 RepID=A0A517T4P8_9PLAN|nr:sigma-70 family RNA polymerase sigma factor [Calycomorphotria hydatis]QDT63345.1 RNA polymerase sigma factor [Calycomorphotria hydatis]